jgi:uncharacterized protein
MVVMLMPPKLTISLLPDEFVVCRLPGDAASPAVVTGGPFFSVTASAEEISVVCRASDAPEGATIEPGWRVFVVDGPLDFSLVGVLNSMLTPLVDAKVPVFAMSTYTTDYVLVREKDVRPATTALKIAGHTVH